MLVLAQAEEFEAYNVKDQAIFLYETFWTSPGELHLPKHIKAAALGGLFRMKKAEAKDLLLAQLQSPEKAFFNVALAAAREMPGADVTAALADELKKAPTRASGIAVVGVGRSDRSAPLAVAEAATKSDLLAMRQAAIYVLSKHRDTSAAAAILLDAALGDGKVAQAAEHALRTVANKDLDPMIVARLASSQGKVKIALFSIAGARGLAAAIPAVRESLADRDPSLRLAAIAALGHIADVQDLDLLITRALAAEPATEVAAARAGPAKWPALRVGDPRAAPRNWPSP